MSSSFRLSYTDSPLGTSSFVALPVVLLPSLPAEHTQAVEDEVTVEVHARLTEHVQGFTGVLLPVLRGLHAVAAESLTDEEAVHSVGLVVDEVHLRRHRRVDLLDESGGQLLLLFLYVDHEPQDPLRQTRREVEPLMLRLRLVRSVLRWYVEQRGKLSPAPPRPHPHRMAFFADSFATAEYPVME